MPLMHNATITKRIQNDHKMQIQNILVLDLCWREKGITSY